ncbi:MAG: type II secretion system F family protein, partial [Clostridioides sp.]|nr:type II secretion system F family protein [Clostridioides sp.]
LKHNSIKNNLAKENKNKISTFSRDNKKKISTFSRDNKKKTEVFDSIIDQIKSGKSITTSFENTGFFPIFFISMLQTAEESGNIDTVLNWLSEYYDKEYKFKNKFITIMIYPLILIVLSLLSIIFILFFIVPNFEVIFIANNINPPFITSLILKTSLFLRENIFAVNFCFLSTMLIFIYLIKNKKISGEFIDEFIFSIPIVGELNKLILVTKFSRSFEILMRSGVKLIDSIDISRTVVGNLFISNKVSLANENLKKGNTLSFSLESTGVFSEMFISILKAGEESGQVDRSLSIINKFYESELDSRLEKIIKLAEPVVIIILGSIIGSMMIALIMPVFDIMSML